MAVRVCRGIRQSSPSGGPDAQGPRHPAAARRPDIRRIRPTVKSRDDIPTTPIGLKDPCSDEGTRKRLFGLPGRPVLPGKSRRVGRPGMEPLTILVLGVVKQDPGCGFDRLQDLANGHRTTRRMMGHYSRERTHQGRTCCGGTPFQTMIEGKGIRTEKSLNQT